MESIEDRPLFFNEMKNKFLFKKSSNRNKNKMMTIKEQLLNQEELNKKHESGLNNLEKIQNNLKNIIKNKKLHTFIRKA